MWKEKTSYISFGSETTNFVLVNIVGGVEGVDGGGGGASRTPIVLTTNYTDNRVVHFCKYLDNIAFDIFYTPSQAGDYLYLLLEVSNDNGRSYVKYVNKLEIATETDVYATDLDTNDGNPFLIPGTKNGLIGHLYALNLQAGPLQADWIRLSAKEKMGGGNLFMRTSFTNNQ